MWKQGKTQQVDLQLSGETNHLRFHSQVPFHVFLESLTVLNPDFQGLEFELDKHFNDAMETCLLFKRTIQILSLAFHIYLCVLIKYYILINM